MKLNDSFRGIGTVSIDVINKDTGSVIDNICSNNLIVKTGRSTLIKMIAGNMSSSVTKMAIGKGGTADTGGNAFNPIAPQDGDTDLYSKVSTSAITSANVDTSQTNPSVTFVAMFDCDDVDSLVNECGLFFDDNSTMFARYTFDTVSLKSTSNISLQISWTIEF